MSNYVPIEGGWPEGWPEHNAPCVGEIERLPLPLFCYNPTIYHADDGLRLICKAGRREARLWTLPLDAARDGNDCSVLLDIDHWRCKWGQEDARHYRYRDEDYIAFAGVQPSGDRLRVAMMRGRLVDKPGWIRDIYPCMSPLRKSIEKNWGMFDHGGKLCAVYTIKPHVVYPWPFCSMAAMGYVEWAPDWIGGAMRGGASPVLHEGLWWSFFHGALDCPGLPSRFYSVGCYAFDPRPPFQPVCHTPRPIIVPPREGWPRDIGVSVVWPGGAVMHNGQWLLSLGIHETWSAVCTVDHELLQRELRWR